MFLVLPTDVRVEGDQVYLVHGTFNETKAQMAGGTPPLASTAFQQLAQWLQAHPTDVVLVLLESYVPNKDYLPPILQASGLEPLIFYADGRNGGWNVEEKGWPTINQMVEMGKRCVVLSGAKEDGMPYEYWYAAENNFGDKSLKPETWAESRWETAPIAGGNFLFICNRFPDMDTTPLEGMHHNGARRNDSTAVFEMVNDITTKIAAKGVNARYPNFIAADMINVGIWTSNFMNLEARFSDHVLSFELNSTVPTAVSEKPSVGSTPNSGARSNHAHSPKTFSKNCSSIDSNITHPSFIFEKEVFLISMLDLVHYVD